MITREQLKTNAKSVLSHTYWMSLASNFIISTVLSAISSAVMIATYLIATLLQMAMGLSVGLLTHNEQATIIAMMFSPGGLIIYAGAIALAVFASNPAQVGLQYLFNSPQCLIVHYTISHFRIVSSSKSLTTRLPTTMSV